jgi:hypothetical protein
MAYEFEYELEDELEEELEDEAGLEGEGWLGAIGNIAGSLLGESEDEDEYEDEYESELSPIRKIYPDAMMEHLGELAAEAESEDEAAEHFLPLIGMAASKLLPVVAKAIAPAARKALPRIAKAITRATPHLTKGVGKVAKILHRSPQTRPLLRTVPGIARRTVGHIARQVAHGRKVTPQHAVRTLAQQAQRVLGTRGQRVHALRRHNHLERRLHGQRGPGFARAHPGRPYHLAGGGTGRATYGMVRGQRVPGASRTRLHAGVGAAGHAAKAGLVAGGRCQCAPCPSCGGTQGATATPAYCRCCGQVIR